MAIKKGHEGINLYTISYQIILEYKNEGYIKVLKTGSSRKCARQYALIHNFLGINKRFILPEEVQIKDESTHI